MLIDSHCHLDYLTGPEHGLDVDSVVREAGEAGVSHLLTVSVDQDNVTRVLAHAQRFENVFASVGVHPGACDQPLMEEHELRRLAAEPRVVAIGETGLDYHYDNADRERQQESFSMHLRVAASVGLPVIVHTRDARQDTLELLAKHADRCSAGVLHCFTESLEMARVAMEMNFMISFSGIITFKSAEALREVVRHVPLERMLVETDSPYLAPVPYRGRRNEPRHVVHVAEAVAAIKGVRLEAVAEATTANFFRLFSRAEAG